MNPQTYLNTWNTTQPYTGIFTQNNVTNIFNSGNSTSIFGNSSDVITHVPMGTIMTAPFGAIKTSSNSSYLPQQQQQTTDYTGKAMDMMMSMCMTMFQKLMGNTQTTDNASKVVIEDSNKNNSSKVVIEDTNKNNSSKVVVEDTNKNNSSKVVIEDTNKNNSSKVVIQDANKRISNLPKTVMEDTFNLIQNNRTYNASTVVIEDTNKNGTKVEIADADAIDAENADDVVLFTGTNIRKSVEDPEGNTTTKIGGGYNALTFAGNKGDNTYMVGGQANDILIKDIEKGDKVVLEGNRADWQIVDDAYDNGKGLHKDSWGQVTYQNLITGTQVKVRTSANHSRFSLSTRSNIAEYRTFFTDGSNTTDLYDDYISHHNFC